MASRGPIHCRLRQCRVGGRTLGSVKQASGDRVRRLALTGGETGQVPKRKTSAACDTARVSRGEAFHVTWGQQDCRNAQEFELQRVMVGSWWSS
jgi:hypothetical protein